MDHDPRACRHLRARQPAAARAVAGVPVRPARAALSGAAQLRHRVLDRWVAAGARRPAVPDLAPTETLTYAQLAERVNRIANVLTRDLGLVPGNRVLLRAPNNPMMVAAYLAVIKAGGVVVATMPLLRAKELAYPLAKAKIALALCDARLADELEKAKARSRRELAARRLLGRHGADALEALMAKPGYENFTACDTASDDVCLIAFTSGTTGEPKGTMHFHRDMLAICDSFASTCCAPSRRPLHRHAAARLHLRARRARAVPAARRRLDAAAREGRRPTTARRPSPSTARRSASPRRPPTARCSASSRSTTSRRCANACPPARRCRRRPSRPGTRRPASRSSTASARPRCCTSSSARRRTRSAPARPAGRCPATRRASSTTHGNEVAARHRRPARGARADRLPLSRRRAPDELRAERLEPHRRHLPDGRRRLLLVPGAHRRHDHLRRLQHRRARGRGGAARRIRGRRVRGGRRPDEERGQIVKAYVVLRAGHDRRCRDDARRCRTTSRRRSRRTSIRARSSSSPSCRGRRPASCSASSCASRAAEGASRKLAS